MFVIANILYFQYIKLELLRQSDVIRLMLKHTKVKKSIQIEEEYAQKKEGKYGENRYFPSNIFIISFVQ